MTLDCCFTLCQSVPATASDFWDGRRKGLDFGTPSGRRSQLSCFWLRHCCRETKKCGKPLTPSAYFCSLFLDLGFIVLSFHDYIFCGWCFAIWVLCKRLSLGFLQCHCSFNHRLLKVNFWVGFADAKLLDLGLLYRMHKYFWILLNYHNRTHKDFFYYFWNSLGFLEDGWNFLFDLISFIFKNLIRFH